MTLKRYALFTIVLWLIAGLVVDYVAFVKHVPRFTLIGVGIGLAWAGVGSLCWYLTHRRLLRITVIFLLLVIQVGIYVYFLSGFMLANRFIAAYDCKTDARMPDVAYEDVRIPTTDGVVLQGWYFPSSNGAAIIALPGYSSNNRQHILPHAEVMNQAGYGVLLVDMRGNCKSTGYGSRGWLDVRDVPYLVDYLHDEHQIDKIGIFGVSLGGQVALRAAAADERIGAVFVEGPSLLGYQDIPPQNRMALHQDGLPMLTFDFCLMLQLDVAHPPAVADVIGKIAPRPILLAGGKLSHEDIQIAYYQKRAGANAEIWVIENASHSAGLARAPEEYKQHLIKFFDKALFASTP